MSSDPQLFRVNPDNKESQKIQEVDFTQLGFKEREHIQEWVASNPIILGEDLLIVGKEFSGFDKTMERLDLLAVDTEGRLVIIELKRDDSGADAHWQAIKYASYLRNADYTHIVDLLAKFSDVSLEEATEQLQSHLGANDLNGVNNDQRIILASHRFAPEVTSAALWLNHKAPGEDLITCIKLTPFRDVDTNSLYVQATTVVPVPGVDDLIIGIGSDSKGSSTIATSSFKEKLKASFQKNKSDGVTQFVRHVADLALNSMPTDVRPNRMGKWAAGWEHFRYFGLWYSDPPWANHRLCYQFTLRPQADSLEWLAYVRFRDNSEFYADRLKDIELHEDQKFDQEGIVAKVGIGLLNDEFAQNIADVLNKFIVTLTPKVNQLQEEANDVCNEEEA